ncbi:type III-B CRISPR module-associated protein Cmr3 [Dictyobacter formicarum]|uniref:CRISPR-associated protein Cmr3 n=1 Tax=Dictyobacter formicarum TaxID=2778368 RepID=A0ABQ3VUD3_9CHLR|nr:type III-B CRISPR module-associated protein Cmr3 [Dictyobacter formicarum]GHO89428.1 CRISPR-associated protein Cmr3 [Dictyobacter formicarum]
MSIWIIEPHDPLLFRDGRPFGASPGAIARSLPFPFPSTIAGGTRSQIGMDEHGLFHFTSDKNLVMLKKIGIRGPILVQLPHNSQEQAQWLAPAPLDALPFQIKKDGEDEEWRPTQFSVEQLVPLTPLAEAMNDLNSGDNSQPPLCLAGLLNPTGEKPSTNTPAYWHWDRFVSWLTNPAAESWKAITARELGIKGPISEERVHVSIDRKTRTGRDGYLFATSSLEFTASEKTEEQEREQQPASLAQARQLALVVMLDEQGLQPQPGPGCLGSERRLVNWARSQMEEVACPKAIKDSIIASGACRLVLLTPTYFAQGYRPSWILSERQGVKPELRAIVNRRPQVVSGWDIAKEGRKKSVRLAPAGTVLFLKLKGDQAAIGRWIDQTWLHCISDNGDADGSSEQYRLDGFGLAALGTWLGDPVQMGNPSQRKGE